MTKLFLILSIVALLGASAVGIANRSALIKVREDKDQFNSQLKTFFKDYDDKYQGEFDTTVDNLKETKRKKAENLANIELAQSTVRTKKAEIETLQAAEGPLDEKIALNAQVIKDLETELGEDVDIETLPEKVETLRLEDKGLREEAETLKGEAGLLAKNLESKEGVVTRMQERQQERAIGISRNSMEATITAVNQDWGFVVFSAGETSGVSNESKLLVKRGARIIGRLNIVSVEPRITVADIDQDSLPEGARILPGDKVIFGNLQE